MTKCNITREIPVANPIKEVVLTLSLEQAAIIRTILANISGSGHVRHLMRQVSDVLFENGITFVDSDKAKIVASEMSYINSPDEYAKFLEVIKKF